MNQNAQLQSFVPVLNKEYSIEYYLGAYHVIFNQLVRIQSIDTKATIATMRYSQEGVSWTTTTRLDAPVRLLVLTMPKEAITIRSTPYYGEFREPSIDITARGTFSTVYSHPTTLLDKTVLTNGNTFNGRIMMLNSGEKTSFAITFDQIYAIDSITIYVLQRYHKSKPLSMMVSCAFDETLPYHSMHSDSFVLDADRKVESITVNISGVAKTLHIRLKAEHYVYLQQVSVIGKPTGIAVYPKVNLWDNYYSGAQRLEIISRNKTETRNNGNPLNVSAPSIFRVSTPQCTLYVAPFQELVGENIALYNTITQNNTALAAVNRIRSLDFGLFDWHDSYPRRRQYTTDMANDTSSAMNWSTQIQNNTLEDWVENIDFVRLFWETKDSRYLTAWFRLTASYFYNMPTLLATSSTTGIGSLEEVFRYKHMLKSLAALCKLINTSPTWRNVLSPCSNLTALPDYFACEDFYTIVRGFDRMKQVLHAYAHPLSGKMPNQRFCAIYNLCAMGYLSNCLKFHKSYGLDYFASFLSTNFFPDGSMIEQSWNYNDDVVEMALEIMSLSGYRTSRIDRYHKYIASLKSPLGTLPVIGTAPNNKTPRAWIDRVDRAEEQLYTTIYNKHSGVHVFRNGWNWSSVYMSFINTDALRGHRLAQNNSIEVYAYGRHLLCQSGPPPYDQSHMTSGQTSEFSQFSDYFGENSTRSRNTILINMTNQNRMGDAEIISTKEKPSSLNEIYTLTESEDTATGTFSYGYGDNKAIHKRTVVFDRELLLFVLYDTISNISQQTKISQVWNFPPLAPEQGLTSGFSRNTVFTASNSIYTNDSEKSPQIEIIHPNKDMSYTKFFGSKRGDYRGWWSSSIVSTRVPKVDIYAEALIDSDTTFITVVNPINIGEARLSQCEVINGELVIRKGDIVRTFKI